MLRFVTVPFFQILNMAFVFYLLSLVSFFFSLLLQKTGMTNLQILQESLAGFWLADRSNSHTQPVRSISAASHQAFSDVSECRLYLVLYIAGIVSLIGIK
jgi:hypothetical protein